MDNEPEARLAGLPAASLRLLQQALSDAVSYRDPPLQCPECETLAGLCGQCAAGLSQARAYLALSRELLERRSARRRVRRTPRFCRPSRGPRCPS
jgi:hypothetical protein